MSCYTSRSIRLSIQSLGGARWTTGGRSAAIGHRVIRLLQTKFRRNIAGMNPGVSRTQPSGRADGTVSGSHPVVEIAATAFQVVVRSRRGVGQPPQALGAAGALREDRRGVPPLRPGAWSASLGASAREPIYAAEIWALHGRRSGGSRSFTGIGSTAAGACSTPPTPASGVPRGRSARSRPPAQPPLSGGAAWLANRRRGRRPQTEAEVMALL
jgi:hypothetical protein